MTVQAKKLIPTPVLKHSRFTKYYEQSCKNDCKKKMKFSIKDFFSKCDLIRSFLWIWSHLLKKSLIENFIYLQALYLQVLNKHSKKLFIKMILSSKNNLTGIYEFKMNNENIITKLTIKTAE